MLTLFAVSSLTSWVSSIGIGNIIAGILAWKRNQDILWTVIGFLLSWLYVIYWIFTKD